MRAELGKVFTLQGGVATRAQLLPYVNGRQLRHEVSTGGLVKIWRNIYSDREPDTRIRLRGLDLRCGEPVVVCLHTAAWAYGFDTEQVTDLHVVHPVCHRLRSEPGLVVHRRAGAPLIDLRGRQLTAAAWTAVDVARMLPRPRALATLDAALRTRRCTPEELLAAVEAQPHKPGILTARELVPLARCGADSPMESESRLMMLDGGLPEPLLQYEIVDRAGICWHVDFAWPDMRVAVEYDGFDHHSSPEDLRRDRQKRAALQELGWVVISIISDDVRRQPQATVRRIGIHLFSTAA